jgi:hypothetical protein
MGALRGLHPGIGATQDLSGAVIAHFDMRLQTLARRALDRPSQRRFPLTG